MFIKWLIAMANSARRKPSRKRFIWSRANWDGLNRYINSHDWVNELEKHDTVNDCYNYFINCYTSACNSNIETTTAPIKITDAPLSKETRKIIEPKRQPWGQYLAADWNSKEATRIAYVEARKAVPKAIKQDIESYEIELVKRTRQQLYAYVHRQQTISEGIHAMSSV